MSDTESDELYTIGNVCFICNHVFVAADEPWYIFNKQAPADGHAEFSISELLGKVLEKDISEDTVHSTFLCEICNANLLEFESLERRLVELRQRIKQSYEETLNTFEAITAVKRNNYVTPNLPANRIDIIIEEEEEEEEPTVVVDTQIDVEKSMLSEEEEACKLYSYDENSMYSQETSFSDNNATLLFKTNSDATYRCLCCNIATFPNIQLVVAHLRSAHKKRIYACMMCEQTFLQKQHLNAHLEKTHVDGNEFAGFECEPCNLTFSDFNEFSQHQRISHSACKTYSCPNCQKSYITQNLLDAHMQTHAGERPYKCHKCDKGFAAKYALHAHAKIHTERTRPYECDKCKKSFFNEKNLTNHLKSHLDNKPYICEFCGKAFKSQHNLHVHNIVHTKVRPYECLTCGKSFARRSEIIDHERTHTGERPFQCDLCPLAFAQRANLSSHKKSTHFNEKLHKCAQCDRAFKRKRLLDYHIQAVHTGERPHKCEVCGMGFVYPEHFKKHLLIHTGLKPFACEVCGKQFKSRDNRNAHRFVHSDKKPYECLQCGAGFMRKPQLLQHMNNTAHATDTIIVNQPQISNSYLKETPLIVTETVVEDNVLNVLAMAADNVQEDAAVMSGHFVDDTTLENVKYLQFEDFDNDEQDTIAWMDIAVKDK